MIKLTMTASMGTDWLDYFDVCCARSRKPLFQRSMSPFFNYRGDTYNSFEQVNMHLDSNNKILHEGNANLLTRHF